MAKHEEIYVQHEKSREELLQEAARKPVRHFIQIDGWTEDCGVVIHHGVNVASELFPDDWDLFIGETYDLRASPSELAVRVQIAYGANRAQVAFLLARIQALLLAEVAPTITR